MLDDIFNFFDEENKPLSASRMNPGKLHKFVVEKPFCCPATDIVVAALHPVGIPIYDVRSWTETQSLETFAKRMKIELKTFENLKYGPILAPGYLPMSCRASFYVPAARARMSEYWLLRSQRLIIIEGGIDPRNEISAARHNGAMPRASDPKRGAAYAQKREGGHAVRAPVLESSCKQAQELWDQVLRLASKPPERKPIAQKRKPVAQESSIAQKRKPVAQKRKPVARKRNGWSLW